MKLKYRIKEWQHPFARRFFTAQYKLLGLWLNINNMGMGRFSKPSSVICETFEEAKKRVDIHTINMRRAEEWTDKCSHVLWESENN